GSAHQVAGACIGGDHLLGACERAVVAAAHDGEHAVLRTRLTAGNRRVDEIDAANLRLLIKLARDFGRGGGVIDYDCAFADAGENAVLAEHDFAQIVVIADAGHDEILTLRGLPRRRRALAAVLLDPFFDFGGGAVINGNLMAALRLEMTRYRVSHDPEPDECDLCHCLLHARA